MRTPNRIEAATLGLCALLSACATTGGKAGGNTTLEAPKTEVKTAADGTKTVVVAQPEISNRAKLLFEDANKAWDAQKKAKSYDYPALERKFQAALDADPELAEAEYDLGVLAERQGDLDRAVQRYRGALKRKPTLKQAAENLAVIAQNKGDVKGAVEIYRDILTKFPDDASSRARLAEVYRRQGDHDKAMELAREALIRDDKTLAAYKVMMRSNLDRRQLAMAKLFALRAIKIDDSDPELYHTVGLILLAEKDVDQARVQFNRAIEVRADYLPSRVELARLALKEENYAGAEQHLRRILQADGKSAQAHLMLGVSYKGMGQYDKAMLEYDEAEKLDAKLAPIYLNRAIILHRHKDAPERAVDLYKKYLSMAGEGVIDQDSPVLALMKEAEQLVAAKAEAAAAEAEMKKQQAQNPNPQGDGAPQGDGSGGQGGDVQPASGTAAPAPKPAAATEKPAPKATPAPADPQPAADEPSDEPGDDL